jgi:hypothetical protein
MKTTLFILTVMIGAVFYTRFLNMLPTFIALPLSMASMILGLSMRASANRLRYFTLMLVYLFGHAFGYFANRAYAPRAL